MFEKTRMTTSLKEKVKKFNDHDDKLIISRKQCM